MEIRKAARQQSKIRIGVSGPSGSGKTLGALKLAKGLVGSWDKIVVIDSENKSADLYSHLGDYSVLPISAPYSPEKYTEAIHLCEKEGFEVIIIDSGTHEWEGKGGCLEINERLAQAKFKGNTWSAWSETTPRHQKFIDAMIQSPAHVICTLRSKVETAMDADTKKVKKIGVKAITREGVDYEFTIMFELDRDGHYATASKDRTGMYSESDPFQLNEAVGETIKAWCNSGKPPIPEKQENPNPTESKAETSNQPEKKKDSSDTKPKKQDQPFDADKDFAALVSYLAKLQMEIESDEDKIKAFNDVNSKFLKKESFYEKSGKSDLFTKGKKKIHEYLEALKPGQDDPSGLPSESQDSVQQPELAMATAGSKEEEDLF